MIYDITLPLSPGMVTWPGDPPVAMERWEETTISRWTLGNHAGTHVDAPAHGAAGTQTVEALDPAVLLGPCRVLDLPDVSLITADVLENHDLLGVERLLLRTRNSLRWAQDTTTFTPDFVGFATDAARLLLSLGLKLIGVDGLSVEPEDNEGRVHTLLLAAGVIIVEGLALAAIPAGDYQLICAPMKLTGADGAPARVFLTT